MYVNYIHFQQRIYIRYKYLVFRKSIVCFLKIYCLTRRFGLPPRCIDFRFCKCTCSGLIGILVQAQVTILWGFLNTLTKLISMVRVWIGSIVGTLIFKVNIFKICQFGLTLDCIDKNGGGSKSGNFGPEWGRGGSGRADTLGK